MTDGPKDPLVEVFGRLVARLSRDPDVRQLLRGLATLILAETADDAAEAPDRPLAPEPGPAGPPADADADPPLPSPTPEPVAIPAAADIPAAPVGPPSPAAHDAAEQIPATPAEVLPFPEPDRPTPAPLPALTLGQAAPRPITPPPARRDEPEEETPEPLDTKELRLAPRRCRLKAEAVRWQVERRRRLRAGGDADEVAARDLEIEDRASGLLGCLLWFAESPAADALAADPALAGALASAFEATADAAELLLLIVDGQPPDRPQLEAILQATAEAQCALRTLVDRLDDHWDDDQTAVFHIIKGLAERLRVYVPRYLKISDTAEAARVPEVSRRIRALTAELTSARQRAKVQKKKLSKLRHLSGKIADGEEEEGDWRALAETIDELVEAGIPPSSVEIRDHLAPIRDFMPHLGKLPRGFELALREADLHLERQAEAEAEDESAPPAMIIEVAKVADLLRGRSIVFFANVAKPRAKRALIDAFELSDIEWIITREHQSIAGFESPISRPDVALVVLPIKWSSHSFEGVKQFCERHGKPFLRLPAGYNPNQVAVRILDQCSEQLRSDQDGRPGR